MGCKKIGNSMETVEKQFRPMMFSIIIWSNVLIFDDRKQKDKLKMSKKIQNQRDLSQ